MQLLGGVCTQPLLLLGLLLLLLPSPTAQVGLLTPVLCEQCHGQRIPRAAAAARPPLRPSAAAPTRAAAHQQPRGSELRRHLPKDRQPGVHAGPVGGQEVEDGGEGAQGGVGRGQQEQRVHQAGVDTAAQQARPEVPRARLG